MKELISYIKKNFEKPENGLKQIGIAHILITVSMLFTKIGLLFIGRTEILDQFLYNHFYLATSWGNILYKPWTLISYFFISRNIFDLILNLSIFHSFGRVINSLLGSRRLLILYFLGGITGGVSFILVNHFAPNLPQPAGNKIHLMAGVYAVIVGTATFAPNFLFYRFFFPVHIKYLALFLLIRPFLDLAGGHTEAVTQLGSALFGYFYIHYIKYVAHHKSFSEKLRSVFEQSRYQSSKKSNQQDTSRENMYKNNRAMDLQMIFDKISTDGYQSLSSEEKKQLFDGGRKA